MTKILTLISYAALLGTFSAYPQEHNKTVLLAILGRNKAHVLPRYLECINNLEYDKKLITVYINTNNNSDKTKEILQDWADQNKNDYQDIIFEHHEIDSLSDDKPHDWTVHRLKLLSTIRSKSLQIAQDLHCDYYFIVDCDNFIIPETLQHLMNQNKPIIAPLLKAVPEKNDPYSNFFYDIDENGYYKNHSHYWIFLAREIIGTIQVPVIHCTYLIQSQYLNKLTYVDGSNDYDFVIFSRTARKNNIDQYICNEKEFGTLLHFHEKLTLIEEQDQIGAYFASIAN